MGFFHKAILSFLTANDFTCLALVLIAPYWGGAFVVFLALTGAILGFWDRSNAIGL
jgi:hypothetical protein